MVLKSLRLFQVVVWLAVLVAGAGVGTMYFMGQSNSVLVGPVKAVGGGGSALGKAPYSLTDTRGQPFNNNTLRGTPAVLFFGFTNCADVCPTTVANLALWYDELGTDAANLGAYFISVDPERDTTAVLSDYLSWQDKVVGVTGTPEEIQNVTKSWGAFYEKRPAAGGTYSVEHTASIFLVGRDGELQSLIRYGEPQEAALQKLRALLAS